MWLARPSCCSVVSLEWAGPGVGGGVVFPLSVSVSLALKLLFSDVFVSVESSLFNLGGGNGSEEKGDEFHCQTNNLL